MTRLARAGRDVELGADLAISLSTHVADTEEKAIEEATPFFEEHLKMFAPLGFVRNVTDEQIAALADPTTARGAGLPTLRDAVAAGSWLCGPPELIAERLMDVQERYPALEMVNVGPVVSTPESVVVEQLAWFAADVLPTFRNTG